VTDTWRYMAIIGFGASISVNDGISNAQLEFAEPIMIQTPFGEVSMIDASHMSMSNRFRLKIPGLTDPGNLSFEGNFTKADYIRLAALQGIEKVWVITAP